MENNNKNENKQKNKHKTLSIATLVILVVITGLVLYIHKAYQPIRFKERIRQGDLMIASALGDSDEFNRYLDEDNLMKSVFKGNYKNNFYISDYKNSKFFIKEIVINDGSDINIKSLYDIADFEEKIKDVDYNEFIKTLENYKYEEKRNQTPYEILNTGKGNCSSITLYIYEWLKINKDPEEYKYILEIAEKDTNNKSYDKHMYLKIKPDGKEPIFLDLTDKNSKFDQIEELKTIL